MGESELQGKKKYLRKLSYLKHDQSRNVSVSFAFLGGGLSLAWMANDLFLLAWWYGAEYTRLDYQPLFGKMEYTVNV